MTPCAIVYAVHGSPIVDGCETCEGRCCLCGGIAIRGIPRVDWVGFDQLPRTYLRAPESSSVCEACCYVTSRVAPVLGRPAQQCKVCDGTLRVVRIPPAGRGKLSRKGDECPKCDGTGMQQFGGNFRNFSTLWEAGGPGVQAPGYANASKGEKPLIREFLARDHDSQWFVAIADTGQKHLLPWTPVNQRGRSGLVLFEDLVVRVPDNVALVWDTAFLLTAGATKEEIERGHYCEYAWRTCETEIRAFEAKHQRSRGSGWFSLSIWLAQRDETEVERRKQTEKEEQDAIKERRKVAARGDR